MGGMGPIESAMFIICLPIYLLPPIASAVFLWLCYKGRFSAPKRAPSAARSRAKSRSPLYDESMVRPERFGTRERGESCCIRLAGESPVAVSAGAPRRFAPGCRPRRCERLLAASIPLTSNGTTWQAGAGPTSSVILTIDFPDPSAGIIEACGMVGSSTSSFIGHAERSDQCRIDLCV